MVLGGGRGRDGGMEEVEHQGSLISRDFFPWHWKAGMVGIRPQAPVEKHPLNTLVI